MATDIYPILDLLSRIREVIFSIVICSFTTVVLSSSVARILRDILKELKRMNDREESE